MIEMTLVTGSNVRGAFTDVTGTLTVGDSIAASKVEATVKTGSFDSNSDNRDAHVKGADLFNVEQFPEMTFVSTGVAGSPESFELQGDLTIKETTKPVTFKVEFGGVAVDPFGATRAGFSATTQISRKEFGITWNAVLEAGGALVGDKVTINIDSAFVLASSKHLHQRGRLSPW